MFFSRVCPGVRNKLLTQKLQKNPGIRIFALPLASSKTKTVQQMHLPQSAQFGVSTWTWRWTYVGCAVPFELVFSHWECPPWLVGPRDFSGIMSCCSFHLLTSFALCSLAEPFIFRPRAAGTALWSHVRHGGTLWAGWGGVSAQRVLAWRGVPDHHVMLHQNMFNSKLDFIWSVFNPILIIWCCSGGLIRNLKNSSFLKNSVLFLRITRDPPVIIFSTQNRENQNRFVTKWIVKKKWLH